MEPNMDARQITSSDILEEDRSQKFFDPITLRLTANPNSSAKIVPKRETDDLLEATIMEECHIDDRCHLSNNNSMSTSKNMSSPAVSTSINKADPFTTPRNSILVLIMIFIVSLVSMGYIYMMFPELSVEEKEHLKIPRDIQDAKLLANVLDRYKDLYYFEVMLGVIVTYIFLQTFAIPGSLFLSILLGFLYRFQVALLLICFCSSLGATLCYCLSNLVGKRLICHFWPKKVQEWSLHVEGHRGSLLNYILFLRMTPVLPNWFINLVSPVIGVPLHTFAVGTFLGVAPPSIIAIQAGKTLQKLTSSSDAFTWSSMGILTICACLSLMPSILKSRIAAFYNKTK